MATSTTAERGREVRRRLMVAAAELIAERGWAGVSTRLVAERAGVTAGLVHYHFASVQTLLVEATTGVMRTLTAELVALLERARTPGDALDAMLAMLDHHTGRDPTSLLFAETYLAAARDQQVSEAVGEVVTEVRGRLADWLAEQGVPAPADTAAVLTAAIDGVLLHRPLVPGMTRAAVAPVLERIFAPVPGGRHDERKAGVRV
nr:TetR/AcrR family transcriptional regulator [Micromonospora sp. DSM 115978]